MQRSYLVISLTLVCALFFETSRAVPPSAVKASSAQLEELYTQNCAVCHDAPIPNAPHRIKFTMFGPDNIYLALKEGVMKTQASTLTDEEKISLAEYLGDRKLSDGQAIQTKMCASTGKQKSKEAHLSLISDWGFSLSNSRFVDLEKADLNKDQIEKLKLKWAFGFSGATRARSQPTVHKGVVYVGSQDGTVYALDLESGCAKWTYKSDAEVRTSVVVGPELQDQINNQGFFGDFQGNVVSVGLTNGDLKWKTKLDDHPDLTITGSPKLFEGVLFVPMSSREWATAADPGYACCSFRGGVVALNAKDGTRLWTSYTTAQPQATGKENALGVPMLGPSGAPVWGSPTIDKKRNRLYIGTGENYSSPATSTSDAVIAMNLDSGKIEWVHQALENDAWNMACFIGGGTNCPEENGPDLDIGAPVILETLSSGKEVLLAGQKSGDVFALDPDNQGKLLWKEKIGAGGYVGGVHWGMAAHGNSLYAPIADVPFGEDPDNLRRPGLFSIDSKTGQTQWYASLSDRCVPKGKVGCDPGISAAVTVTNDMVFAGALDGYLMAFDRNDGTLLWEFSTDRQFLTVSGELAHGGSIESDGPVVIDGHLLVNSGYSFGGRMPGNVLLVFSIDGN